LTIQCFRCGHQHQVLAGSRDRTCPACASELYRRVFLRYQGRISDAKNLKFLTLTWKPVLKQDSDIVAAIGRALNRFLHRHPYHHWKGVLAVLECKKTAYNWFYYHVHCLFDGFSVPQGQISHDWREISGFSIVWVKAISRTPKKALRYILKYVLKGFAFDDSKDRSDFKESMRGVHYVRSYADFYDLSYHAASHVYFPCPECGAIKSWIVVDFCNLVDLLEGIPYDPPNS